MLPPVAEVYVVWHPDDRSGAAIASGILDHFHGTPFTGLIGGAVEVYGRCHGWRGAWDAPRPIPLPGTPPPNGLEVAQLVAVVPVLATGLAASVERGAGPWHAYIEQIIDGHWRAPRQVGVFPVILHKTALDNTNLASTLGQFTAVGGSPARPDDEPAILDICRDLTQALAQFADPANRRLTIFISHTRNSGEREAAVSELISLVRSTIRGTRLSEFFDASTIQSGEQWAEAIRRNAASSALLAVRTDHYANGLWCQEEMLIAKRAGMPIVVLDALDRGDERGSFLMDHVPRVPVRRAGNGWQQEGIIAGLNRLVGECLKRALWRHQQQLARDRPDLAVSWWAPHAPEPTTLADWLVAWQTKESHRHSAEGRILRIIHPDPPLTRHESEVLEQLTALAGLPAPEIMTPRSLAARGG